jgi:hypothetical protein
MVCPPGVLWAVTAAGKTTAEFVVGQFPEVSEIEAFHLTEPISARFGRKETKAVQRPKSEAAPVSEVRSAPASPFETWENFGA